MAYVNKVLVALDQLGNVVADGDRGCPRSA
jgi:hypothetical protein